MRRCKVALAVLVLAALAGTGVSQAGALSSQARTRTLHLRFARAIGAGVTTLVASKRYVLAALGDGGYRIFDDARGRTWRINTRPCGTPSLPGPSVPPRYERTVGAAGMFGAPWALFHCSRGGFALYNVADRRWQTVGGSASSGQAFRDAAGYPFEVGARWIKLTYSAAQDCGDHIHFGCGVTYRFYNIRSRSFQDSPQMSSSTIFDLDSPRLVQHLCAPIQAPPQGSNGPMGTMAMVGRFAVELTPDDVPFLNNVGPQVLRGMGPSSWSLQGCGSNSRLSIDSQPEARYFGQITANDRAVLWSVLNSRNNWTGAIAGRFLPSLQRFTAVLPGRFGGDQGGPVLDSSHIYVLTRGGALWRAPFPLWRETATAP